MSEGFEALTNGKEQRTFQEVLKEVFKHPQRTKDDFSTCLAPVLMRHVSFFTLLAINPFVKTFELR